MVTNSNKLDKIRRHIEKQAETKMFGGRKIMVIARCREEAYKYRDWEDTCCWCRRGGEGLQGGHSKATLGATIGLTDGHALMCFAW